MGVCPRGARVRRSVARSRKPDSSRNTRTARRLAAFFYTRPFLALPAGNLLFVALTRAPLRLLRTPMQAAVEDLAHMLRMVRDPKRSADYCRHALAGPEVGLPPMSWCPLQQYACQFLLLFRRQAAGPSRHGLSREPVGVRPAHFPPTIQGGSRGPQNAGITVGDSPCSRSATARRRRRSSSAAFP
jgi:hypothetical protein